MNGDFGASVEDDSHEESSGQSSAVGSPAAKWFAPAKQPLRSASGKHWSKSRRNELGVGSPTSDDQVLMPETSSNTQPETVSPDRIQPGGAEVAQRPRKLSTAEQTDYNTAQNSMSALNLNSTQSPATNKPGENPMRRPSLGKDQNPPQQQPVQQTTPQPPTPAVATASVEPRPTQKAPQEPQQPTGTGNTARRPSDNAPTGSSPTKSALASSSSAVLSMSNLYERQVSYKYLPLELASAAPVKNSIARNILFQSLGHGLLVIKHGTGRKPFNIRKCFVFCLY